MDTDMAHTLATGVQYIRLADDDGDLTNYAVKKHGREHGIDTGIGGATSRNNTLNLQTLAKMIYHLHDLI